MSNSFRCPVRPNEEWVLFVVCQSSGTPAHGESVSNRAQLDTRAMAVILFKLAAAFCLSRRKSEGLGSQGSLEEKFLEWFSFVAVVGVRIGVAFAGVYFLQNIVVWGGRRCAVGVVHASNGGDGEVY